MMERIKNQVQMIAAGIFAPDLYEAVRAHLTYEVVCLDACGNERWRETIHNLVVTQGLNNLLDVYFDAATQTTVWYLGLKGSGTAALGDTLASHPTWSEVTAYTGTRKSISWGTSVSGSLPASAAATFAITGTATIAGAFLATVTSGTGGILYSAGDFAAPRSVGNGDTLNVTPTVTAA